MTNEEQIIRLKAQAYDFLAMKQHAEQSLIAINGQIEKLIKSAKIDAEITQAAAEEKANNPSVEPTGV